MKINLVSLKKFYALFIFILCTLTTLVLKPLFTAISSDIMYLNSPAPAILYYIISFISPLMACITYAAVITVICRAKTPRVGFFIVVYLLSIIYSFGLSLVYETVSSAFYAGNFIEQLFYMGINLLIEGVQLGIIFMAAQFFAKKSKSKNLKISEKPALFSLRNPISASVLAAAGVFLLFKIANEAIHTIQFIKYEGLMPGDGGDILFTYAIVLAVSVAAYFIMFFVSRFLYADRAK